MKSNFNTCSLYKDSLTEKLEEFDYNLIQFSLWKRNHETVFNEIPINYKALVFVKGKCSIIHQGTEYYLQKGDVLLVAPYTMYSTHFTTNEPCEYYYIHFNIIPTKKSSEFATLFKCSGCSVFPKLIGDSVIPMIEASYQNILLKKPGSNFSAKLVLLHLFLNMLQNPVETCREITDAKGYSASEAYAVRACMDYLDKHMYENVKVSDLCDLLNVSQAYLFKCFKNTFKLSTKEFLSVYRFHQIEMELVQTNRPIQEISDKFGFTSVYSFSSAFKKQYGVSPLQYRKNSQVGLK